MENKFELLHDECEKDSDDEDEDEKEDNESQVHRNNIKKGEARDRQKNQHRNCKSRPLGVGDDLCTKDTAQIYIGGVSPSASTQNVVEELIYQGVPQDKVDVQLLSQNTAKKSFIATIPVTLEKRIIDPQRWAEGIIVRPFLQEKKRNTLQAARVPLPRETKTQQGRYKTKRTQPRSEVRSPSRNYMP